MFSDVLKIYPSSWPLNKLTWVKEHDIKSKQKLYLLANKKNLILQDVPLMEKNPF